MRQYDAGRRARNRQRQTVHKQLSQHSSAAGANRRPNGDLALAGCAARQKQARHVHGRDQENDHTRDQQHHQRGARVSGDLLVQRLHAQSGR
jgi:hypothetical protein